MKTDSRTFRVVFASPWALCAFFVIPLLTVASIKFQLHLPLGSRYPLLFNNIAFCLFAFLRLCYYLGGLTRSIRYSPESGVPGVARTVDPSPAAVRSSFALAGFLFAPAGDYAEKKDTGYLGTVLLYAGLFLAVFTGSLDNARQFSGTLFDGVGTATDLNLVEKYRDLNAGPFSATPAKLPKMQIIRQYMPDATYPRGATEVAFQYEDGRERTVILKSPVPYRAGGYDIYMSKMVYEPNISISLDNSLPVYSGTVRLDPLADKIDGYGFYGTFVHENLEGEAFFQPETSRLRLVLRQGPQLLLDKVLVFQADRRQVSGNLSFTCEKMGVWSEIHVVHHRHMPVVLAGALCALLGLLVRGALPAQRVWLEEAPQGTLVRVAGRDARKVLSEL